MAVFDCNKKHRIFLAFMKNKPSLAMKATLLHFTQQFYTPAILRAVVYNGIGIV